MRGGAASTHSPLSDLIHHPLRHSLVVGLLVWRQCRDTDYVGSCEVGLRVKM